MVGGADSYSCYVCHSKTWGHTLRKDRPILSKTMMQTGCNRLTLPLNGREVKVNLITKVYYCSPLYEGKLKGMNEMTEELILCGKVVDHKFIKGFMVRWGAKAIMPEYLIPGYSYFGLGALLSHREPVRDDISLTLLNALSRHPPKVIRSLWALSRKGPEIDYYQNTWAFLNRYGVSLAGARDTGLIVTTSHRVALWPDPRLKEILSQIGSDTILWMGADSCLADRLSQIGRD